MEQTRPPISKVLEFYGADLQTVRGYGQWRSILCPFHEDSTASGRINETLDGFKCMACDVAGDSWKIIMEREGLKFAEAVRFAETSLSYESRDVPQSTAGRRPYQPSWT